MYTAFRIGYHTIFDWASTLLIFDLLWYHTFLFIQFDLFLLFETSLPLLLHMILSYGKTS